MLTAYGIAIAQYYDEREDEGWRRAVENVLEMSAGAGEDPYRRSVLFRPAGLRGPDGEVHRARRLEVEPGARATLFLRFHNPHLTSDDVGALTLRALAEDSLRVTVPERFPAEGELELPVEVLEGRPQLTLQIGPTPAQHTQVTEQFRTKSEDDAEPALPVHDDAERRAELLAVYDFVQRNATFSPGDQVDFYERFHALLPEEQRVAEEWALFHHAQGEGERAYALLRTSRRHSFQQGTQTPHYRRSYQRTHGTQI